jgi:hypothetical protein
MKETGAILFENLINEIDVDHSNACRISNDRTALSSSSLRLE